MFWNSLPRPVTYISVEESYQRFLWCYGDSIPRGFRPTYTPCFDKECQDLLKSGDPDIAYHLLRCFVNVQPRLVADLCCSSVQLVVCRRWQWFPHEWHRVGTTALSEGFFLAFWPGFIRIRSAGRIFGFPRLVYSLRYSRGGRRRRRLHTSAVTVEHFCRIARTFTWETSMMRLAYLSKSGQTKLDRQNLDRQNLDIQNVKCLSKCLQATVKLSFELKSYLQS